MKKLFICTALVEIVTGITFLLSPEQPISQLVGAPFESPGGLVVARIAGGALLALGLACWLARDDAGSPAAQALLTAMLLYNVVVAAGFLYAGMVLNVPLAGLYPPTLLHTILAVWCAACRYRFAVTKPSAT